MNKLSNNLLFLITKKINNSLTYYNFQLINNRFKKYKKNINCFYQKRIIEDKTGYYDLTNYLPNGKKDGRHINIYSKVITISYYDNNKLHGKQRKYFLGEIISENEYVHGVLKY